MCIQMDAELWKAHDPACERKPRVELAHSAAFGPKLFWNQGRHPAPVLSKLNYLFLYILLSNWESQWSNLYFYLSFQSYKF